MACEYINHGFQLSVHLFSNCYPTSSSIVVVDSNSQLPSVAIQVARRAKPSLDINHEMSSPSLNLSTTTTATMKVYHPAYSPYVCQFSSYT